MNHEMNIEIGAEIQEKIIEIPRKKKEFREEWEAGKEKEKILRNQEAEVTVTAEAEAEIKAEAEAEIKAEAEVEVEAKAKAKAKIGLNQGIETRVEAEIGKKTRNLKALK